MLGDVLGTGRNDTRSIKIEIGIMGACDRIFFWASNHRECACSTKNPRASIYRSCDVSDFISMPLTRSFFASRPPISEKLSAQGWCVQSRRDR